MEKRLRDMGYSRSQSTTLASKYFAKLQKERACVCHNIAVTVERDDQPTPSTPPATGSDRREEQASRKAGLLTCRERTTA